MSIIKQQKMGLNSCHELVATLVLVLILSVFNLTNVMALPGTLGAQQHGIQKMGSYVIKVLGGKARCLKDCRAQKNNCTNQHPPGSDSEVVCWDAFENCQKGCSNTATSGPTNSGNSPSPRANSPPRAVVPSLPAPPPAARFSTPQPETIVLQAQIWPTGKWPEGIAFDGKNIWVAESGERKIAQFDIYSGNRKSRKKVGRLPVDLIAVPGGKIFALAYTDKIVWAQPQRRKGKRLAKLKGYPTGMAGDERALWVLVNPGNGSDKIKIVRVDQRTGKTRTSRTQRSLVNGADIAVSADRVWVVHGKNPGRGQISIFDKRNLTARGQIHINQFVTKVASNFNSVFVSGGSWGQSGVVIKYDTNTQRETARVELPGEFIGALSADEHHVIAVGRKGTIWMLSPHDLSIERTINLTIGQFAPQSLLVHKNTLYITTHRGNGKNGSVIVVNDARSMTKRSEQCLKPNSGGCDQTLCPDVNIDCQANCCAGLICRAVSVPGGTGGTQCK